MGIYIGDTEIKGIYLGDTPVKEVYLGDDKIRPTIIPITTPGIYHNATLGLISLSSDGSTRLTIADKNLGATTSDVTSTASYGDYYSRGAKQNRNGQSASGYTMQEDRSLGNQTISPTGYHIPTQAEWTSLVTTLSSLLGISTLNYNYARQYLLLPRSGQMTNSGTTIQYAETAGGGYYWSSTKANSTSAYILRSTASLLSATGSAITFPRGFPIRLFKDTVVQPRVGDEWSVIIQLKSYQDIKNMTYGVDVVAELNKYPSAYYAKLNSEGHMAPVPRTSSKLYWIIPNPSNPEVPDEWLISAEQPYNDSIWYYIDENTWDLGV